MKEMDKVYNPGLQAKAKKIGYESLDDFFNENFPLTYSGMAEKLGVSYQHVSIAYRKYLDKAKVRLRKENSKTIKDIVL